MFICFPFVFLEGIYSLGPIVCVFLNFLKGFIYFFPNDLNYLHKVGYMLDVFQNAKNKPTDKLSNTMAVNAAVDEELQAFYYTGQDVETTLQNIEDRINAVLK